MSVVLFDRLKTNARDKGRLIFWALFALGLALRFYGIAHPYLDSHAERQTQVAMVARNLSLDRMNILCTRLDIFGNNRNCTLLEFPTVHALAALLYTVFGTHEIIGRLVALSFSMLSVVFMHRLALLFLAGGPAIAATAIYTLSPSSIYFGRAFMPESAALAFSIATVYLALKYLREERSGLYAGSVVCGALALLSKTTDALILAPILVAWLQRYTWKTLVRRVDFLLYLVIVCVPVALWSIYSLYVDHLNPAIPAGWQLESIVTGRGGLGVLLHAYFYADMGQSIVGLLLTPAGLMLTVLGLYAVRDDPSRFFIYAWLGAVLAYFVLLPGANAGHVYYQLPLLPVAALLGGFGAKYLGAHVRPAAPAGRSGLFRAVALVIAAVLAVGHLALYRYFFSYMYDLRSRMPYVTEVAQAIREQTPQDAAIVIEQPAASTTVLTYYAGRRSWDFSVTPGTGPIRTLEHLRLQGAVLFVAVDTRYASGVEETKHNPAFWRLLNSRYRAVRLCQHYLIYDLTAGPTTGSAANTGCPPGRSPSSAVFPARVRAFGALVSAGQASRVTSEKLQNGQIEEGGTG